MNNTNSSSLSCFNFVNSNDEDMVHLINNLVDLIKEYYKIIKNEIKEGKTILSNEELYLQIIINIELQLNSFIYKAKEIINQLKITRKRKSQCEKTLKTLNSASPRSNLYLYKKMNLNNTKSSSFNIENELKKSFQSQKHINNLNNNKFISIEKYKNNIINKNKQNKLQKYNLKESKNSTVDETSFDFKNNLNLVKKIIKNNNNNLNNSNFKRNISVNKIKLSNYKNKTNYSLYNKKINQNKLQDNGLTTNNLTISKLQLEEIKKLQKELEKEKNKNNSIINYTNKNSPKNKKENKLEDNIIKNLEITITKLTSDLKNSNNLYSNVKKKMENDIESIIKLKNEIKENDKIYEKESLNKNNSENNDFYKDLIEKNKLEISELHKINTQLSNKNNELSLNNLELTNSKNKLLNENSQLIIVKKELENQNNNLKKQLETIKNDKNNIINYSFSNMTNSSNLVIISNNNESDGNGKENLNENEIDNNKIKHDKIEQITKEMKELQKEVKIKNLTINALTEELNLKDNQISELIVEKANLSNNQNMGYQNKLNRSKSEEYYSNLKKENNQLIKQLSKIKNNLGNLFNENEYNKAIINKLNKKINNKANFQSKELIEKYEQKLNEINNKYKTNEKYLQEQINELKLSNIEKDENNKALQNEYLKLKWDIEEKK